jgi:hypothetical protein
MLLAAIQRITTDYVLAPMITLALATIMILIIRHTRM